jgi:hypothetical protein
MLTTAFIPWLTDLEFNQGGGVSVVLLHHVLFVPCYRKSVYSWKDVKSIGRFTLIDEDLLQVVRKSDRSVVINTFQSGNDFVLDLIPSESAAPASDSEYEI